MESALFCLQESVTVLYPDIVEFSPRSQILFISLSAMLLSSHLHLSLSFSQAVSSLQMLGLEF